MCGSNNCINCVRCLRVRDVLRRSRVGSSNSAVQCARLLSLRTAQRPGGPLQAGAGAAEAPPRRQQLKAAGMDAREQGTPSNVTFTLQMLALLTVDFTMWLLRLHAFGGIPSRVPRRVCGPLRLQAFICEHLPTRCHTYRANGFDYL